MPGRPRDSQRSKVYKSERECKTWCNLPIGAGTMHELRVYVDAVLASTVWRELCVRYGRLGFPVKSAIRINGAWSGERCLRIKDGRGTRVARGGSWYINIPRWARNEMVVLHELAHTATVSPHRAWHGWEFCDAFLLLVESFIGFGAAAELRERYKANRVRITPKKKTRRPMTLVEKEAARKRAAHAREVRMKRLEERRMAASPNGGHCERLVRHANGTD